MNDGTEVPTFRQGFGGKCGINARTGNEKTMCFG
jgi:hypothetical protein